MIRNQIEKLLFEISASQENYILSKESEDISKTAYEFALKSFEVGKSTLYEVNTSRNNYLITQLKSVQSKYETLFKTKELELFLWEK